MLWNFAMLTFPRRKGNNAVRRFRCCEFLFNVWVDTAGSGQNSLSTPSRPEKIDESPLGTKLIRPHQPNISCMRLTCACSFFSALSLFSWLRLVHLLFFFKSLMNDEASDAWMGEEDSERVK